MRPTIYLKTILSLLLLFCSAAVATAQDMTATPLTLEAVTAGDITFTLTLGYADDPSVMTPIEYQKNDGQWTTYAWGDAISVAAGDKVAFRGNNAKYYGNGTPSFESHIVSTADVYVYGNVMSLISSTDFAVLKTLTGKDTFSHLFSKPGENVWEVVPNTTIKSHPTKDLVLPATKLTNMCYYYMFAGCQGLTRAPELPATDMPVACYGSMFEGCTGLTKAPALPTTVFTDYGFDETTMEEYGSIDCYMMMFKDCTGLTEAPALPATKLVHGVYQNMFQGCTSLKKAPELPASEVADYAYSFMFDGCTSLNYVKCLATEFLIDPMVQNTAEDNVKDWLRGVSATGTFVKADAMTSWQTGDSGIPAGWTVKNASEETGLFVAAETPLTLEAVENGTTVTITNPLSLTLEYSADGGTSWTSTHDGYVEINDIAAGSTVSFRGNNAAYSGGKPANSTTISSNKDMYVYGNVMSLIGADNYATNTTLTEKYALFSLFDSNTHLKNHDTKDLVLPATTLTDSCYNYMFYKTGLTRAPQLPATTLANGCYQSMFSTCSSMAQACELPATAMKPYSYANMFRACPALTTAPALPATALADYCYSYMFYGSGITAAPQLPATTLARYCYNMMFGWCSSLTAAPELPATELADYCYRAMFVSCKQLTTPSALPATTLKDGCYLGMYLNTAITTAPALNADDVPLNAYYQMFQGCTSLTSATIAAKTVGESACENMFKGCTALVNAPDLPATTLGPTCYNFMFSGCTALEKAPKLPATTLATQCYQRMFEDCTSLVMAPALPATELAELCYNDMFWECTALKNAPELPATTLADYCYTMMFLGCSSLETAPDLPAVTLTPGCYEHMFMNCSKLNYVKCLATDLGDESSTDGWLTNVAATGTFVQAEGADWTTKGTTEGTWGDPDSSEGTIPVTFIHGIPAGWTVLTDTATGVDARHLSGSVNACYDLTGRKVSTQAVPGIYVRNGKKIIVRNK